MTQNTTDLTGKHVVVVGGGSGIGRATAALAASRGATVTISSRTESKLKDAAAGMEGKVDTKTIDMTDEASVKAWVAALDPIDHLIISASSAVHGPFAESETDAVRGMFEAKFLGPFVTVREALGKIKDGGSVTMFSGVLSRRPGAGAVALGAVNAAVEGLARGLALELGPKLRVNVISPGMTDTEAYAGLPDDRREAMFRDTASRLPLQRIGTAEDIAEATLLAATSGFMTGHVMDVDGGHMVQQ